MLINRPQVKIIDKVIKDEKGNFVLAYFAILEWEGQIYVKLIKTEPAKDQNIFRSEGKCCLSGAKENAGKIFDKKIYGEYIPFSIKDFSFLTSQLTRAPSLD